MSRIRQADRRCQRCFMTLAFLSCKLPNDMLISLCDIFSGKIRVDRGARGQERQAGHRRRGHLLLQAFTQGQKGQVVHEKSGRLPWVDLLFILALPSPIPNPKRHDQINSFLYLSRKHKDLEVH